MFDQFNINQLVNSLVPLIIAVTVHEVAHGYVAWKMGDPTARLAGRLSLNPIKHIDPFGSVILPLLLKLTGSPVLFGYAKPVPVNYSNLRNQRLGVILVSLAGVTANFGLAIVSALILRGLVHFQHLWYPTLIRPIIEDLYHMMSYSVLINLILMVFNLIPVPPLDGSRVVSMLLPPHLRMQYDRIERFGMVIIIFLILTGALGKLMAFFVVPMLNFLV